MDRPFGDDHEFNEPRLVEAHEMNLRHTACHWRASAFVPRARQLDGPRSVAESVDALHSWSNQQSTTTRRHVASDNPDRKVPVDALVPEDRLVLNMGRVVPQGVCVERHLRRLLIQMTIPPATLTTCSPDRLDPVVRSGASTRSTRSIRQRRGSAGLDVFEAARDAHGQRSPHRTRPVDLPTGRWHLGPTNSRQSRRCPST
jgi:hypothetical protein